eukprot:1369580-Amphidinium_carterae.3
MNVLRSNHIKDFKLYINRSYQHDGYDLKHNKDYIEHSSSQQTDKKEYDHQTHRHRDYSSDECNESTATSTTNDARTTSRISTKKKIVYEKHKRKEYECHHRRGAAYASLR